VRDHHWGRTICESDTVLFTTLTLSFNPLYTNRQYAQALGHPDLVVNPLLVFNVILGLSVEDNSEIGGPFVGVGKLTHRSPVYPGDTLRSRSTTVSARRSESNPANGIVTWHTEGFNHRDEQVIDFERSNLVRLRHPPQKVTA
jgi:itaconyl-CoA hydratase